ncbi:flavodoxin family protein [Geosporobacter ferrireducens]|uniref:NADPH-dependent FMN reductase n=1 Tax=Geosporobacter ferrireducens TaxID=1424294 RepID=A0A1D8GC76_9FIRM|nr:flavodoxin family protein [Geosporobacter ferrireducens]AOT68480.1 NADPH-dependent FMN reductase [Geosporobacter ferrireducens]MTI53942.1 flavodoxin family protein [Geosporobacter ferrireducens]
MKALAIMGSPRSKKNTDLLLDAVIEGLTSQKVEVEKIELRKLSMQPCNACDYCGKSGICAIKDDLSTLYGKFNQADIVVIGSPIYFNSVSSITKIMIDRCQAFWSSKYVLQKSAIDRNKKRNGLFLCTAGSTMSENGFIGATIVMELFFRAINTNYKYNLLVDRTDNEFVGDRKQLLDDAFELGQKLIVF